MKLPTLDSLRELEPTEDNIKKIEGALNAGARLNRSYAKSHGDLDSKILEYTDGVAKILKEKIQEGIKKGTLPKLDISELKQMGVLYEKGRTGGDTKREERTVVQSKEHSEKPRVENIKTQPPTESP